MKKYLPLIIPAAILMGIATYSCISEKEIKPVDCSINPVVISSVAVEPARCKENDGKINIVAAGGSGTYTYSINGTSYQVNSGFENLAAGAYTVSVKDDNGCSAEQEVKVDNESGLILTVVSTTESGCGTSNGKIELSASDGFEPYMYKTEGGNYQDSNILTGLFSGDYTVYTIDANGCETMATARVETGISYENSIATLIAESCATASCHDGSNDDLPDFTDFEVIQEKAGRIKIRTGEKTMPPGGGLSDEEIAQIACWVDDGALDN